ADFRPPVGPQGSHSRDILNKFAEVFSMLGTVQSEVRASYAFVERNFNLVKRYWGWEVVWLCYSVANALAITFIGKASGTLTGTEITPTQMQTAILYLL